MREVTEREALAVRAAVETRYAAYFELGWQRPTLVRDYDDQTPWLVLWEEGPYEWSHRVADGGVDNERAAFFMIVLDLGKEEALAKSWTTPIDVPPGIEIEPYEPFSLAIRSK